MGIWNMWGEQQGMQFEKGGGICRYVGSSNLRVCKSEAQRNVLVRLSTKTIWVVLPLWRGNRWWEFKQGFHFWKMICPSIITWRCNSDCTLYSSPLFFNYYELWLLKNAHLPYSSWILQFLHQNVNFFL